VTFPSARRKEEHASEPAEQSLERPRKIPLSDIAVDEEILAAAEEALASGWWSMGPRVARFESEFASFCGTDHAVAVSSGTAALHLALLAAGCGGDTEIVLPSLNFVAAANVVVHAGGTPVFCDVCGPEDLSIDPASLERAITPRTRAVIVLHYAGFPCDMESIMEIAARRELVVIEDAAHSPGATWRGKACGAIGDAGCFSFFANKNLPVGEGGMIVTDDVEIAQRLRLLRSHGMTTTTWDRERGHAHSYDVATPGFNYRMDEAHAAVGSVQLGRIAEANAARARLAGLYRESLGQVAGLTIPFADRGGDESHAHHLAVVVLPRGASRDAIREELRSKGIETSVHYPPIHHFSYYADHFPARSLVNTDDIALRILTLPLFAHMSESDVELVSDALAAAIRGS
jgi:dTDP-4-amino-4,6-dideoxygalactose transaminase